MTVGTVTNHALPIGKGPATTGFGSLTLGDGQIAIGQTSADPQAKTITGDVTITAGGVTAIGTAKVTAAMIASMTSAQLRMILSDETGTGLAYFQGGALGTPASGTLTNATGLPPSGLTTQGAYTFLGNNTGSSASPTAVDIATLTTKASPGAGDYVMLSDQAASGAWKKVTVSTLATAGSVSSIAGNTGAFTLSNGVKNVTNDIQADPVFHRSYLAGLTLSTAGSSATFGVAAGVAVDSTNTGFMSLASAYTKTTSAWAVGTGNGALDTGSIAASTWYHVHLIKRTDTGVVDVLVSLSATAPTLPTNYTLFRRIGSMKTNGSSQWTKFIQVGDEFIWDVPPSDLNGSSVAGGLVFVVSVPTGLSVMARLNFLFQSAAGNAAVLIHSPLTSTQTAVTPTGNAIGGVQNVAGTSNAPGNVSVMTNTSQQVRGSANSTGILYVATVGWTDTRGKWD